MAEVPEFSKVDLRMTGQTPGKSATGKKVLSGKRELSAALHRKVSLTDQEIPAEMPQSAKETPTAGRKVVLPDDGGTAWFREEFGGVQPQSSFSSEGQLPVKGPGGISDVAAPIFGKEVGQGLLEQVESQLHLMALRGREKITLQLHPAFLGKLKMNVSLQNHHLVAEMTTDSAMTREILSSHVHTLKEALMDQGIRLERFDVHLQDNTEHGESRYHGQAFQEQARQQQPGRSYSGTFLSEDVPTLSGIAEVSPGAAAMAASSPGINLFV